MDHSGITDSALVDSALKDKERYSAIVERFYEPLSRYVYRIGCKNEDDRDDILQEVFIKAYVHLHSYDRSFSLSTWLYRIAHNETMSFFRKHKLRAHLPLDDILLEELGDEKSNVEGIAQKAWQNDAVQSALQSLDDKYKVILTLRYLEEKSYDEIADILEKPPGTVATLVHRAKAALKKTLTAYE